MNRLKRDDLTSSAEESISDSAWSGIVYEPHSGDTVNQKALEAALAHLDHNKNLDEPNKIDKDLNDSRCSSDDSVNNELRREDHKTMT